MIRLDVKAFLPGQSFKAMFALDGLVGVRGELAVIENLPTCMVNEQGATCVNLALASEGVGEATMHGRDVVIG